MKRHRRLVTMFAGGGTTFASGGVGTYIRYLTDEWAKCPEAPTVRVIDTRGEGGKVGMGLHFLKAVALLLFLGPVGRIGVLHIHMSAYGSALRKGVLILIGDLMGLPVIVHMHGSNFHKFYSELPKPLQKALRYVLRLAHCIIVLGENWRDFLATEIGIEPQNIAVIVNGVPGPVGANHPAPLDATVRIVFLGQLGERKGVPDLLAALQMPRLLTRQWTATIAGDGPVDEYRDAVAAAGLQDRVRIPGWVDRETASKLLWEADIFVLPSYFEAMPIAILEAMAHSVAVIATPVGAIPEFLTDGETALLIPPGAPDLLADAIARLMVDETERRRLGAAGNRVFRDRFDICVAATRILALYESAMLPTPDTTSAEGRSKVRRRVLTLL